MLCTQKVGLTLLLSLETAQCTPAPFTHTTTCTTAYLLSHPGSKGHVWVPLFTGKGGQIIAVCLQPCAREQDGTADEWHIPYATVCTCVCVCVCVCMHACVCVCVCVRYQWQMLVTTPGNEMNLKVQYNSSPLYSLPSPTSTRKQDCTIYTLLYCARPPWSITTSSRSTHIRFLWTISW